MKTTEHMFYYNDIGKKVPIDRATKFCRVVVDADGKIVEESFGSITKK